MILVLEAIDSSLIPDLFSVATAFPIAGAAMLLHLPRGPEHKGPLLAAYYLVGRLQA